MPIVVACLRHRIGNWQLRDWLVESVAFYRGLGFFTSPKTDEQVADWIERVNLRHRRSWRRTGPLDDLEQGYGFFHDDLTLLRFDRRRALWLDFESPGMGGHGMYAYQLGRLARISRGAFEAYEVEELALGREMDVDVLLTFRVRGIVREYVLGGGSHDWVDWKLLWIAQEQFDSALLRLHAAGDPMPGQEAFLVALTVEERERITAERGLEFHPLPEAPVEAWHWWWPTDRKQV